jgi:hypothetical protein
MITKYKYSRQIQARVTSSYEVLPSYEALPADIATQNSSDISTLSKHTGLMSFMIIPYSSADLMPCTKSNLNFAFVYFG